MSNTVCKEQNIVKYKANYLISKFMWNPQTEQEKLYAKQCALICCDEIITHISRYEPDFSQKGMFDMFNFYTKVREEIKKL